MDAIAPTIACAADATIQCPASPSFPTPTASDACGTVTLSSSDETLAGNCATGGKIKYSVKRTWVATDECGNTASCSQTISVEDTTAPVLSGCPSPNGGSYQCLAVVPAAPTVGATDTCQGAVAVSFNEIQSNPGSSCNHTITRTWTATDDCGNAATCTQTITVNDTTKPIVTCPAGHHADLRGL